MPSANFLLGWGCSAGFSFFLIRPTSRLPIEPSSNLTTTLAPASVRAVPSAYVPLLFSRSSLTPKTLVPPSSMVSMSIGRISYSSGRGKYSWTEDTPVPSSALASIFVTFNLSFSLYTFLTTTCFPLFVSNSRIISESFPCKLSSFVVLSCGASWSCWGLAASCIACSCAAWLYGSEFFICNLWRYSAANWSIGWFLSRETSSAFT